MMKLSWTTVDKANTSIILNRTLTFTFVKNSTVGTTIVLIISVIRNRVNHENGLFSVLSKFTDETYLN